MDKLLHAGPPRNMLVAAAVGGSQQRICPATLATLQVPRTLIKFPWEQKKDVGKWIGANGY